MSWFFRARGGFGVGGQIFSFVHALTEPILGPLRNMLQRSPVRGANSYIDFSPIFGYFLVDAVAIMLAGLVGLIRF
ncbi:MAG: YggT family protein [Defluviitaleaceae bacterium]|nr:YggT family protein [Defluviitaleaceae bacterium]